MESPRVLLSGNVVVFPGFQELCHCNCWPFLAAVDPIVAKSCLLFSACASKTGDEMQKILACLLVNCIN